MDAGAERPLPSGRVTLLLTDVEGSTAAWDRDPARMDAQMELHDEFVAKTVEGHGGLLLKSKGEGDSTFSVFAEPAAAVAAALDVLRGLPGVAFDLPVRASVHTGDVAPRGGDYFGPVPNRAARLRALAAGGQILLSSSVFAEIGDGLPKPAECISLGIHQLRGLAEPEAVYALAHPDLSPVEPLVVVRPPSNLPAPVDAFVGRDEDRTALEKALGRHRLVTIVGPGGVGKTRLALETAADQAHSARGGTWFVDVGPMTSTEQLGPAIVSAVGGELDPGADAVAVAASILEGRALLVLDTCEAMLDATADVVDRLLVACEDLSILATSREALGVRGEAVLRLDPMALADANDDRPSDAARLFLTRAGAADLGGESELDLATVERICRALDGVPLAIELAAAQVGVLELGELADQLAFAVGVEESGAVRRSGPARQRTVRATVEWSLRSASDAERDVLRRLSVFPDGWPRGAPEVVCADDTSEPKAIAHAYAGLVARSLVVPAADTGAGARHRLLDAVRSIAAEHLTADDRSRLTERFVAWCVERAEALDQEVSDGRLPNWVAAFRAELPNLRAGVVEALAAEDAHAAQSIAACLAEVWLETGAFVEAIDLMAAAIASGGSGAARARVLAGAAMLGARTGSPVDARAYIDEALAIVRGDADVVDTVRAEVLSIGALIADFEGDAADVRALCQEGLKAARRSGSPTLIASSLNNLACSFAQSEHRERLALFQEAAAIEAAIGAHVIAQVQFGVALGLGGWSTRALAQVEPLSTAQADSYSHFAISQALAVLYLQAGDFEGAEHVARQCVARGVSLGISAEESEESTLTLGRALHNLGRLDEALSAMASIQSAAWSDHAMASMVEVLLDQGRLDEAAELIKAVPMDEAFHILAAARIDLAFDRPLEALARVTPVRELMADYELGYAEAQLLDLEHLALTRLGRDVSEVGARRAVLRQRAATP